MLQNMVNPPLMIPDKVKRFLIPIIEITLTALLQIINVLYKSKTHTRMI